MARAEDDQKKMQEEFEKTKEALETSEKKYKLLEERCVMLDRQKDELKSSLAVRLTNTVSTIFHIWHWLSKCNLFDVVFYDMF